MAASSPKSHDLCQIFLNTLCRRSKNEQNTLEHLADFSLSTMTAEKRTDEEEIKGKYGLVIQPVSVLQTTQPVQEDQTCITEQYVSLFRSEKIVLT